MTNPWDELMEKDDEFLAYEKLLRRKDKLENCLKLREYIHPEEKRLVRGKWPCCLIECPNCLAHRAERLGESLGRVFEMASNLAYLEVDDSHAAAIVKKLRKKGKRYVRCPIDDNTVVFLFEPVAPLFERVAPLLTYEREIVSTDDLDLQRLANTLPGKRISTSFGIKIFPNQRVTENDRPDDGDDIEEITVPHLRYDGSVSEILRDDTWAEVLEATKHLNPRTAEALERDLLTVTSLYRDWIRQALAQEFEADGIPPERAAAKAHLAVMMGKRRKNVNLTRLDWKKVNELRAGPLTHEQVQEESKWYKTHRDEYENLI